MKEINTAEYIETIEIELKDKEGIIDNLKYVIRLTYKIIFAVSVFLALPTIWYYLVQWKILYFARDAGIFLFFIITLRIFLRMRKKEKEEKENGVS